ncbi:VWA domain-containing protein [Jannaschia marina]|uniref:VWA domain-containing protein n=1 Tax=Jannaschia marina TaxID=2741674 RepID=UPI001F20965A|nr:VWA domain-containing protein [Jannaschia marina]
MLARFFPLLCALALPAEAAAPCASDAMVVFDASASMGETVGSGTTRLAELQDAMARVVPRAAAARRLGLLTYGPGGADACAGLDLRFPPRADAAAPLLADLATLAPDGLTPLSAAVEHAAEALGHRENPAVIVLVTDGNESCDGAPCALAERLAAEARDLMIHVLGLKVVFDFHAWNDPAQTPFFGGRIAARCLADRTSGEYASTETVGDLIAALERTLACPLIGARPALRPAARG